MALTAKVLEPFRGPSVWRVSDCVHWVYRITDLPREPSQWHLYETEALAVEAANQLYGSYIQAAWVELVTRGYRQLETMAPRWPDVVLVRDVIYGSLPAGVGPGGDLLIRHPFGLSVASGEVLALLRRF